MNKKAIVFFSVFILIVSFGLSQERAGSIYGTVVDDTKNPLPGVTVTLISDLTGELTFITTDKGSFRFLSLSPGFYNLKAELTNFTTVTMKDVRVEVGANVTLTLAIKPTTVQEEITVIAAVPTIDKKKTTRALHLTVEELQVLPTARDPWVILELAPGVVMDRENVGGSESGQQSRFVSRGESRATAGWNLDGIDRSGQVSEGESGQYFDFDAFEEFQIQTAATDITSYTAGTQINIVTKRGGNRLSGDARVYYTSDKFQSENTPTGFDTEAEKVTSIGDYGVHIGGPIIKDKLWFWTGFGYQDIERLDIVGLTIAQQLPNFGFKLNASLGKHRLEGDFSFANSLKQGRIAYSALDARESRYNQTGFKPFFKIQDEITFSQNLFLSLKAFYGGYGFKLTPIGGVGGIAYSDDALRRYWGTYRMSDYGRAQYFYQISGNLFQEGLFGVDHELKFGVEYKHAFGQRVRIYQSQRLRYKDYEAGKSRRAYIYRNSDYDYRMPRLGVFLQDSITTGRFTILAGLRYDRHWGFTKSVTVPGTNVDWAGEYNLPSVTTETRNSNVIWNVFSPRLGIIYDVAGDGKTLAKLNFGIYGSRYESSFLSDLASTYGYVYWDWNDLNRDELVQTNEIKKPRVRDSFRDVDPSEITDPDMTSPKTLEFTAGVEREILPNFAIGGTFIYRRISNQWWSLELLEESGGALRQPRPDDYVLGGTIPDAYGGYSWYELKSGLEVSGKDYTTNRPDYYERFLGFEFSFKKRFTVDSKWLLNGSFTYQDWRRFYPTENSYGQYDPTNHKPVELLDGQYAGFVSGSSGGVRVSMNPRWMFKLGFAYRFPWEINVGGTFITRDGYILPKHYTDYDAERAGIEDYPSVYISEYGTYRLGTFSILNLRLDKTIRIKEVVGIALIVDLFNVFNSNTTLDEEYTVTARNYGAILKYLNPRIFRIGVRVSF